MNTETNMFLIVIFYSVETLLRKMKGGVVCALSRHYDRGAYALLPAYASGNARGLFGSGKTLVCSFAEKETTKFSLKLLSGALVRTGELIQTAPDKAFNFSICRKNFTH